MTFRGINLDSFEDWLAEVARGASVRARARRPCSCRCSASSGSSSTSRWARSRATAQRFERRVGRRSSSDCAARLWQSRPGGATRQRQARQLRRRSGGAPRDCRAPQCRRKAALRTARCVDEEASAGVDARLGERARCGDCSAASSTNCPPARAGSWCRRHRTSSSASTIAARALRARRAARRALACERLEHLAPRALAEMTSSGRLARSAACEHLDGA